jgi:antitoxin component YwqK of YwqJK toxin-antitoxin module
MKRLLLIVLPLLLIVGCSKPIEDSTLINKDGLMYSPDSDKPYTGEVFSNYDTGEKLYQGTYEDGLLIDYSYLNEDGSVKEPINYETTLVERDDVYYTKDTNKPYSGPIFSFDRKGLNKKEGLLVDGKMITYTDFDWYDNGQKKEETTFKDGIKHGLNNWWYENGQMKFEGRYKDGKGDGLVTGWYENGHKKQEITYKDGEEDGLNTYWYENGMKKSTYKVEERIHVDFEWYENGQKKSEETWKDREQVGITRWYKNGQKKFEWTYKDGNLISEKNWNEDGSVQK